MSSDKILAITRKTKSTVNYPQSQLGNSLNMVARLIAGGLPTRVYYVSQGGFDTHATQIPAHDRLMNDLNLATSAFVADLKAQKNFDRILVLSFSEFGRRVAENASGGTDHGAAAPLFVLGGGVKPGLYGNYPSLTDLHDGDLKFSTDFRSAQSRSRIGREKWIARTCGKNDHLALFKVLQGFGPHIWLDNLLNSDSRHNARRQAGLVHGVSQSERVHDGRQHPHVIGRGTVHADRAARHTPKNVAPADDNGNFHAQSGYFCNLINHAHNRVTVDAKLVIPHERLTRKL
jgi:hypothetical protein